MAHVETAHDARAHVDEPLAAIVRVVRGEFLEMPGLSLTFRQAMRLWNLDAVRCELVLERLVRSGFLTKTRNGLFRRLEGEP
jgi:hypothetical protein